MWMSLARRWMAVKIVESTSRMIGLMSLVSRSTVRLSSPCSSSRRSCIWNFSVASSSTRCELSLFLRMPWMADGAPTITLTGVFSCSEISSISGRSLGSETTMTSVLPSRRAGTKP